MAIFSIHLKSQKQKQNKNKKTTKKHLVLGPDDAHSSEQGRRCLPAITRQQSIS